MADELDDATPERDDVSSTEAAALSLALSAAAHHEQVAAKAARFLEEQTKLVRLQAEDLRKEDVIRHWSLRVRHTNDLMKLAFGVSGAVLVTVIMLAIAALVWNAHEATGLVIQPLSAPPDFAQKGLTGTVLAQRLLDKLNHDIGEADKWSFRAADNISGNWGNDSKVEIPETGISVFELWRFLRQLLGHETSMSGELYHTENGIALTVRTGADAGTTFEGREQDLDALLSRAAQSLLEQTQPYRYVWVLYVDGKSPAEIVPVAQKFADAASDGEQAWRRSAWEETVEFTGEFHEGVELSRGTVALAPQNPIGYLDLSPPEWAIGHLEDALDHIRIAERLIEQGTEAGFAPKGLTYLIENCKSFAGDMSGAFGDAVRADVAESKTEYFNLDVSGPGSIANDLARDHDIRGARSVLADHPKLTDETLLVPNYIIVTGPDMPSFFLHAEMQDWKGALGIIEHTDDVLGARNDVNDLRRALVWPWLAYAQAMTGALKEAEALIARTPVDCTLCLEMRGRIAEIAGDRRAAENWYDHAIADAPEIPFAETDKGLMALHAGDAASATGFFARAHRASPHFPDALELWGEALMQENRSDLALAKFKEADQYAPNWGRLHLEWGKALRWSGDKQGARREFAIASRLGLSEADRRALQPVRSIR